MLTFLPGAPAAHGAEFADEKTTDGRLGGGGAADAPPGVGGSARLAGALAFAVDDLERRRLAEIDEVSFDGVDVAQLG